MVKKDIKFTNFSNTEGDRRYDHESGGEAEARMGPAVVPAIAATPARSAAARREKLFRIEIISFDWEFAAAPATPTAGI